MAYDNSDVIGFIGRVDKENSTMRAIRNNSLLTVGRSHTCDVPVGEDMKAGRSHGLVEANNAVVSWRVCRTKNGTYVNGMLVDYPQLVHLWDGDTIMVGNTPLTYMERRKMPVDRNATAIR